VQWLRPVLCCLTATAADKGLDHGFVIIPFVTPVLSAWLDNEAVGVGLVVRGLLVSSTALSNGPSGCSTAGTANPAARQSARRL
jgi:hypothetical protein